MSGTDVSRRRFLIAGAVAGSAAAAAEAAAVAPGASIDAPLQGVMPWESGAADAPPQAVGRGYVFFNPAEAAFVEAATARLIPGGRSDPGAIEAGVPYFIDRQLAGPFGRGDHFYLQGPWPQALPTQGYQSRFTPAKMYRAAVQAIDAEIGRRLSGKTFHKLGEADQDSYLHALEGGKVSLEGVDSKAFFAMLLQNTKEGFFSDPIYGGNKNLVAWKMIGFPGARYDYRDWVPRHGQSYPLPPTGIRGRTDWERS